MITRSRELFFKDYPDGKMICCIRDPQSWYSSTCKHNPQHENIGFAMAEWKQSTQSAIDLFHAYGHERVLLLSYSNLLLEPRNTMRNVAEFMEIDFHETLLVPSYLGVPVKPNSSYAVNTNGINPEMLNHKDDLADDMLHKIETESRDTFEAANNIMNEALANGRPQNSKV